MSSTAATVVIILGGGGRPRVASISSESRAQPDNATIAKAQALAQYLSATVYDFYGVDVEAAQLDPSGLDGLVHHESER
ncbi:MAG: hypothetical protein E6Q97_20360 [Desulfurellales bacterium]|nr:MAG: hypothetical protein E6Q97_20360 [Desulfurellales bacterium]